MNKVDTKQLVEKLRSKCSTAGSKPVRKRAQRVHGEPAGHARVTAREIRTLGGMKRAQILVWLALKLHSGNGGECWPSVARLVDITGLDRRTVQLARAALVQRGALRVTGRSGKRSIYAICDHGGDPQIAAIHRSPLTEPIVTDNDHGGDPQIAAIPRSQRSTEHSGGDLQITPPDPRGRSPDHPEHRTDHKNSACPPARSETRVQACAPQDEDHTPPATPVPATPQARAGARRLPLARARLELVGVPQDALDAIDPEYLGALSAHDYSTALRAAERLRSVAPLLEEDPDVQSGSST